MTSPKLFKTPGKINILVHFLLHGMDNLYLAASHPTNIRIFDSAGYQSFSSTASHKLWLKFCGVILEDPRYLLSKFMCLFMVS